MQLFLLKLAAFLFGGTNSEDFRRLYRLAAAQGVVEATVALARAEARLRMYETVLERLTVEEPVKNQEVNAAPVDTVEPFGNV